MRQLSGVDAGFLSLETANAPMAIAGLSVLDPETPDGRFGVDELRRLVRGRLDRIVAFRRRLATVPLDLARPYWVELAADEIDLELHIERTTLPEPGGWHELSELMAFELQRPFDRSRPLWQMLFVEGVQLPEAPPGAVALIGRVHHAAIDGVAGAELLGALFDGVPAPPAPPPESGEPPLLELLARAGRDLASLPLAAPRRAGRSLLGLAGGALARLTSDQPSPPLPFSAPPTPFNRSLGKRRSWAPAFIELDRIRALKKTVDATVNDVVLAICAGALRGWLAEREALPRRPLVAMVPVSVRAAAESGQAGNQVSAMLVSLATDEPDPRRRLVRIRDDARAAKLSHRAVGARTLAESAELLPFALSGAAARLYSRLHLAEIHRPPFNLVITNVPGPPTPLSVGGARLLCHAGAAPVFDGLGLILPVFSYCGMVSIGVTADRDLLPEAAALAERLEAAMAELEAAI